MFGFQPTAFPPTAFLPPLPPPFHTNTKIHWQVRRLERPGHRPPAAAAAKVGTGGHVVSSKATSPPYRSCLIDRPLSFARIHRPPHLPPYSRHATHPTASVVPNCCHPRGPRRLPDVTTSTRATRTPPSRHPPITTTSIADTRAAPPPPQQRPLPLPTTTHASNAATTTSRTRRCPLNHRHHHRRPPSTPATPPPTCLGHQTTPYRRAVINAAAARLHAPHDHINTTALALASHQPRLTQPP
ncbi:hypothetical protein EDB86DRAFT_3074563 [Lactarius hatsudake]|nr:hypothetical protein EDB86DRAFT_3074563 [Lactarius hatsudake]